jgi:DNA-binding MarR family transcriptional regulator
VGRVSDAPVPLARLLLLGYRQLMDGLHERLRERGWTDVRESYGFVLLATRGAPTTTTDLATLLGVSKQATSKLLDAMEASGYVERSPDPDDARQKVVALAPKGHELLGVVEEIYAELEGEWAHAVGAKAVRQVRTTLTGVVLAANEGTLPAVRP